MDFPSLNAVLFDLDGVIVDSMPRHAWAWIKVLSRRGLKLRREDIFLREGMSGPDSVRDIFAEKGRPLPSDAELEELILKKHHLFEKKMPKLFPFAEQMLQFLHSQGVRLGVVTGSPKRTLQQVLPGKMLDLFDSVVTADDTLRGKPDPEPYSEAVKRIGISPEKTMAVENAPLGIASARGAGLTCAAIETTLGREYLAGADMIFPDHDSLFVYLKKHFSEKGS